ncbi:Uncharacterised protein [Klebsiella michiganensis]|nr:Uncharacterised protein [Klebsiella michiganensis]
MRSIASGELCHSALCSRGRRRAPCPGYEFSTVCGMVARTGAQRRLRETCARGLETMTGVEGHRVFSGSEYQRWIRAAKGSVALRHLYPVAFRQADNRQLWRNHQQLADPLFAGLAFMAFRQRVGEMRVNLQREQPSAAKPLGSTIGISLVCESSGRPG